MSIALMTAVWDIDLPDSQKIVLLALADCANDDGQCWPSIAHLCRKCTKGERTIQGVIKTLTDAGHLTRQERPGKGCLYLVHPRRDCTPAEAAPPQGDTQTPAEVADKPSRTVNNDLSNDKSKRGRKKHISKPDGVDAEVWADFLDTRKKPFTQTALKAVCREADKARWTLNDAFTEAAARGWQSFKADWIKTNDRTNQNRPRDGVAAALDRRIEQPSRPADGQPACLPGSDGGGTVAYLAAVR